MRRALVPQATFAVIVSRASSLSSPKMGGLETFKARSDLSWLAQLREDPEAERYAPNRESREVKSGHYVRVQPQKLPNPRLVMYSEELARDMGLSEAVADERFARFLSGDTEALDLGGSWATPYALSIMGEAMYHNCPFGNGNGYGDGRAISIGEVVVDDQRFELQLKGGGRTPFCRGADGRAVLRSSIREFLASEAMHFLGVPTTRALSLVASGDETARRPWYSGNKGPAISESDPRLKHLPEATRRMLIDQLSQSKDPDVAVREPAAITCRVAPSFLRVGHVDLFGRRAAQSDDRIPELAEIVAHALYREFPDLWDADIVRDLPRLRVAALEMARGVKSNIADLVANWLRVGFCQGNFNADNCLVAGRTMDYGPFGFMDRYDPKFAKWVGSGDHFAFAAQPRAGQANFATLVRAIAPLFDDVDELKRLVEDASTFEAAVVTCYSRKLGFTTSTDQAMRLWRDLQPTLRAYDYTVFFRTLADAVETRDAKLFDVAAYTGADTTELQAWLDDWISTLDANGDLDARTPQRLRSHNPKYVLREFMLVNAYEAAYKGDFSVAHELHRLVKRPYDEQPDMEAKYFVKAPDADLQKPGTAFMT